MNLRPRIPATIVTGFLGAGKTSLLRHLVTHAKGRIALVINEFGELGIDRELLLGCGIEGCQPGDVVELANGCICCTVANDFLPTIETILGRAEPPDHIVIETSGLALPKPLVKAFAWPQVKSRVTVDGVISVIDAAAYAAGKFVDAPLPGLHENPLEEVFADQLACADLVILNKTDLVDGEASRISSEIAAQLRPGVKLLRTKHGIVDPAVLLGLGAAAEDDLAGRPSHHDTEDGHNHDDFESFSVAIGPVTELPALTRRLGETIAQHNILRVKGFLDVPGKPMRLALQGVGPRLDHYYDRPWRRDETRGSTLVVIGLKGLDRDAITAELSR
jgi:cobalamin biosynthesis protein CobW